MNTEEYEKAKQECWEQFYDNVVCSGSQNYEYWFNDVWNQAYNLGMEVAKKEQQSEIQKKTKENADTFASDNKHFDSTDVRFKKID